MPWSTRAAVNCHSVPLAAHSTDDNVKSDEIYLDGTPEQAGLEPVQVEA